VDGEGPIEWLEPKAVEPLGGSEKFTSSDLAVEDFWRWAFSDLRENVVRGVLAEFLVAKAARDPSLLRHAWDNYDVTTPSGTKIEVKSSAYLQSWRQKQISQIKFSGLIGRSYSYETNAFDADPTLRADLYVFALHCCQEPDQYDVLDLDSWAFYVVPVETLRDQGSPRSISKAFLDRLGTPALSYAELPAALGD
jgi:hypothetical protein